MSKRDEPQLDDLEWQSLAIRSGIHRTAEGEHSEPIFTTSSYVFDSAAHAAERFSGEEPGNVYSRYTNPTVRGFEERLAALEGAEKCVATASGMSAILSTAMALLKAGDHVICSRDVFGTTRTLFAKYLAAFGVEFDDFDRRAPGRRASLEEAHFSAFDEVRVVVVHPEANGFAGRRRWRR